MPNFCGVSLLVVMCCGMVGCHTIRYTILGEKEELSQGERAGNNYQNQGIAAISRLAWEESYPNKIRKWVDKILKPKPASPEKKEGSPQTQESFTSAPAPGSQYCSEGVNVALLYRRLFVQPGEECRTPLLMEIYRQRGTQSRWKWILEPHIEAGEKDSTQGLYQYLTATLIKNIENLQGKAGIRLEW